MSNIYAAVVLYETEAQVTALPVLIRARSHDEAVGKTRRLGEKFKPKKATCHVKVNTYLEPVEPESSMLRQISV